MTPRYHVLLRGRCWPPRVGVLSTFVLHFSFSFVTSPVSQRLSPLLRIWELQTVHARMCTRCVLSRRLSGVVALRSTFGGVGRGVLDFMQTGEGSRGHAGVKEGRVRLAALFLGVLTRYSKRREGKKHYDWCEVQEMGALPTQRTVHFHGGRDEQEQRTESA